MKKASESVEEVVTVKSVTEADKIWKEIKDKDLGLFSLPGQTVEKYFTPITVEPTKAYLTFGTSSAFPALETVLGDKFEIEQAGKYVTVKRK